jgi:hypothetical protein
MECIVPGAKGGKASQELPVQAANIEGQIYGSGNCLSTHNWARLSERFKMNIKMQIR